MIQDIQNQKTILIVEDNESNIDMLLAILKNYDVLPATSGNDALGILKEEKVDLILLDILMPEMDGYEVCRIIKDDPMTTDIPVIFLTAKTDEESVKEAYRVGGIDYVTKPFFPQELLARVDAHLIAKNYQEELLKQVEKEVAARMQAVKEKEDQQHLIIQQSKMAELGEMIGAIAHQLKQPLTAISLLTDLMKHNGVEDQNELNDIRNQIDTQVAYMSDTITNFREYARPNKEKVNFTACKAVDSVLKLIGKLFSEEYIIVTVEPHDHFEVFGYPNDIKNVIMNVLSNSKDAFEGNYTDERKINVRFECDENFGKIIVTDNAGGIPEELLPDKLFEPYVSTKGEKGTGIGLRLAKTIIEERMKGKIYARNIDQGAEITIELPLYRP